jgi:WD40 repeat protein
LWEVSTGRELAVFKGHEWYLFSVAFSADGSLIASSSGDQTVRLWDREKGTELAKFQVLPEDDGGHGAYRVALSPNEKLLGAACSDNVVRLWKW